MNFEDFIWSPADHDGTRYLYSARDLQKVLGYSQWQSFEKVVLSAANNLWMFDDMDTTEHFRGGGEQVTRKDGIKGRKRLNFWLTREACCLTVMRAGINSQGAKDAKEYVKSNYPELVWEEED